MDKRPTNPFWGRPMSSFGGGTGPRVGLQRQGAFREEPYGQRRFVTPYARPARPYYGRGGCSYGCGPSGRGGIRGDDLPSAKKRERVELQADRDGECDGTDRTWLVTDAEPELPEGTVIIDLTTDNEDNDEADAAGIGEAAITELSRRLEREAQLRLEQEQSQDQTERSKRHSSSPSRRSAKEDEKRPCS